MRNLLFRQEETSGDYILLDISSGIEVYVPNNILPKELILENPINPIEIPSLTMEVKEGVDSILRAHAIFNDPEEVKQLQKESFYFAMIIRELQRKPEEIPSSPVISYLLERSSYLTDSEDGKQKLIELLRFTMGDFTGKEWINFLNYKTN